MLISNVLGMCVDTIYSYDITVIDIRAAWIGALAYTFQIYYDFSGYSDMAIGLGKMFGFDILDMPDRFETPADNYRVLQIVNYLKENTDLRVVYPYEELMSVKEYLDDNIYYKTDTHWNQIGGYVGAAALLKELGINMPSIEDDRIHITKINNRAGDLASMLHLLKELTFADFDYQVDGYETHNVQNLEEDFNTVFRYVADNADPRKLYVRRDSFSTAMAPYIGSQFNESYFRYSNTYSYEDFAEQHPDVYVYETVERLAYTLKDFSIQ